MSMTTTNQTHTSLPTLALLSSVLLLPDDESKSSQHALCQSCMAFESPLRPAARAGSVRLSGHDVAERGGKRQRKREGERYLYSSNLERDRAFYYGR